MFMTTTETVPGYQIGEILGLVTGNTIRSRNIGSDFGASLKSVVGGELKGYTQMLTTARDEAIARMVADAETRGAQGIINVRFTTSQIAANAAEILAYGTAVRFA